MASGYQGGVPGYQPETGTYKGRGKRSISEESNQAFFAGAEEMAASIESIKKEIEEIRRPSGTQTNPARSCKDLYLCNKGKQDGRFCKMFWKRKTGYWNYALLNQGRRKHQKVGGGRSTQKNFRTCH